MPAKPWTSDIVVTDELVTHLIETQFGELDIDDIKCIGEGWDNKVFLVNNTLIFRFPHRKVAAQVIQRENTILKNIHGYLELDIPNPICLGSPTAQFPFTFHGYSMVKGKSACSESLRHEDRVASITPLATFLKRLHSISEEQANAMGAKPQLFDRTESLRIIRLLSETVEKINAKGIVVINKEVFEGEIAAAMRVQLPSNKVLVHGDLYSRHLMFYAGKLTGVIDWGDTGINSPAVDLAVVFSFYPKSVHECFLNIYGHVDDNTWQYARFLGLHSAFMVLIYAYDTGDHKLMFEAKGAIDRINPALIST